jgi:hypothetical protein
MLANEKTEAMMWVVPMTIAIVAFLLFVFAIPAIQAKRRGYSFFIWLLAGILALNPIYLLVVLSTVPHRKRQRLRATFAEELDARLKTAGIPMTMQAARPAPGRSLGDLATMDPGSTASRPASGRSLGNELTRMPSPRSLGDEETRE